jgi:hypothetical protein
MKLTDYGTLPQTKVVCKKCQRIFERIDDGEKYWIKSDDIVPFVRCKECYSHPNDIMKEKKNEKVTTDFGDLFDSLDAIVDGS